MFQGKYYDFVFALCLLLARDCYQCPSQTVLSSKVLPVFYLRMADVLPEHLIILEVLQLGDGPLPFLVLRLGYGHIPHERHVVGIYLTSTQLPEALPGSRALELTIIHADMKTYSLFILLQHLGGHKVDNK